MLRQRGIAVLPLPGKHRDLSARCAQDSLHRLRRAAASKHQRLFAGADAAAQRKHPAEAVDVRIVSVQAPVGTAQDGIDAPQRLRCLGQPAAIRNDRLFVGNRHVQTVEAAGTEELPQSLRRNLEQLVGIVPQQRVNLRGIAVRQMLPQKSAAHHTTSE